MSGTGPDRGSGRIDDAMTQERRVRRGEADHAGHEPASTRISVVLELADQQLDLPGGALRPRRALLAGRVPADPRVPARRSVLRGAPGRSSVSIGRSTSPRSHGTRICRHARSPGSSADRRAPPRHSGSLNNARGSHKNCSRTQNYRSSRSRNAAASAARPHSVLTSPPGCPPPPPPTAARSAARALGAADRTTPSPASARRGPGPGAASGWRRL